jgi:hypothetical protein
LKRGDEKLGLERLEALLARIVAVEESAPVDWPLANSLVDEALAIITEHRLEEALDPYVIKYLDDIDVRESDAQFGDYQRAKVLEVCARNLRK